ncbi:MAG: hypothetical protein DMG38_12575 [Acidobacteria bacterium]|nr:MAG: hypothetical protein DMG38_12575 [Acidobacteriota bacterium]
MKWARLNLGMVLVFAFATTSRAQDRVEVFGGYSYVRASVNVNATGQLICPGPPCPTKTFSANPNLNGWEANLRYKPLRTIGLVADFGGNYGALPGNLGNESTHVNTYLLGPQICFPGRISPFVHALFGGAHESTGSGVGNLYFFPAHSSNAFALALGGGVDVKALQSVHVRLIQVEYLGSNLPPSFQNQVRTSAGLVFQF